MLLPSQLSGRATDARIFHPTSAGRRRNLLAASAIRSGHRRCHGGRRGRLHHSRADPFPVHHDRQFDDPHSGRADRTPPSDGDPARQSIDDAAEQRRGLRTAQRGRVSRINRKHLIAAAYRCTTCARGVFGTPLHGTSSLAFRGAESKNSHQAQLRLGQSRL